MEDHSGHAGNGKTTRLMLQAMHSGQISYALIEELMDNDHTSPRP